MITALQNLLERYLLQVNHSYSCYFSFQDMQKLEALLFLVCLSYPYGTSLIFLKSFGLCSGFICSCIRISAVWRKVNVKSFHADCFSLEEKIIYASCFLLTLSLHCFVCVILFVFLVQVVYHAKTLPY